MTTPVLDQASDIPAHVPRDRVVDFDFRSPPGLQDDVQRSLYELKKAHPRIFWSRHYGGHWVITDGADIKTVQSEYKTFSSSVPLIPRSGGSSAPPLDLDPPAHAPYRLAISPSFSPKAVAAVEARVRELTRNLIDGIIDRGGCEFVSEFAQVLPIETFLGMMELPAEDRLTLLPHAEKLARGDQPAKMEAFQALAGYLAKHIQQREENPGSDPLSRIVHAKVNGQRLTPQELVGMAVLVLGAGLDTVASLLGFIARFLATHPEHRRRLIERPEMLPKAIEEFYRRFGLVSHAREVIEDTELDGVPLRKGDIVLIPNVLVGLDDVLNPDPLTVDFERMGGQHAIFSSGAHRCPGANLATKEVQIFLEEWLARIPDFTIKPGTTPEVVGGNVITHAELWLSWPTA